MRTTRALMGGFLALTLAACTSGATPAPSPEPSPVPSVEPSTAPSPAPTEAPEALALYATFDGTACTYTGPLVIPDGTLAQFSYAASEGTEPSMLVVIAVLPGTTWADVEQAIAEGRAASDIPPWISERAFINVESGSSALMTIRGSLGDQEFGGFFVGCGTAPEREGGTDTMYPAALIEIGIAP